MSCSCTELSKDNEWILYLSSLFYLFTENGTSGNGIKIIAGGNQSIVLFLKEKVDEVFGMFLNSL